MVSYLNDFFFVLSNYAIFLFKLEIAPGVSIGSIFLLSSLFFVVVTALWARS